MRGSARSSSTPRRHRSAPSPSRPSPGVGRSRPTPSFIDDLDDGDRLLADIDSSAPKVAAAVRWWIVFATLGSPGRSPPAPPVRRGPRRRPRGRGPLVGPARVRPRHRHGDAPVAGDTRCWRSAGEPSSRPTSPRSRSSARPPATGWVLGAARARCRALGAARRAFPGRDSERQPDARAGARRQQPRLVLRVHGDDRPLEEGRAAMLLPMMDASLAPSAPTCLRSTPPPDGSASRLVIHAGAADVLDHRHEWMAGLGRDWTWPLALA